MKQAKVDCVLSYCHHTLLDNTLAAESSWLQQQGVGILNASPLAMGLLSSKGPPPWHPAPDGMKAAWEEEKASIMRIRDLKDDLDRARTEVERAEREADLEGAARLRFGTIPELERGLDEARLGLLRRRRNQRACQGAHGLAQLRRAAHAVAAPERHATRLARRR